MISDRIPESRAGFSFELELDGTKVTGVFEGRRGSQDISEGTFDPESGEISWSMESRRGDRTYSATIEDGKMTGVMSFSGRDVEIEFTASKGDGESAETTKQQLSNVSLQQALVGVLMVTEDPVSGEWAGVIENENLPGGRVEFTVVIKMDDKNQLSGTISSQAGDSDIVEGSFDPETGKIMFEAENEEFNVSVEGEIEGKEMSGSMSLNDGMIEIDFGAEKKDSEEAQEEADDDEKSKAEMSEEKKTEEEDKPKASEPKADAKKTETKKEETKKAKTKKEETKKPAADDPITGQWEGNMISQRGEREIKLMLNFKSNTEITGAYESTQGEREISSGKFDPETKMLTLTSETERFTLQFSGTVEEGQYEGDIDVNDGAFSMKFEVARKSKEATAKQDASKKDAAKAKAKAKEKYKQPTGEKSLSKLLPGPRWVSSIETSKFKKERCYITFDGHRSNDDGVHVFVTEDSGKSWKSLTTNLPDTAGSARVLREDTKNQNLLFLGCEFSSWYSIDQGKTWTRIKGGLPTVSVHEFAIHGDRQEIVAATHGRSIWIADISVLQQVTTEALAEDMHLFQPRDAISWSRGVARGNSGTRRFVGTNPSRGTMVAYSLGKNARSVRLTLQDLKGDVVKTFESSTRKGFHQMNWDLTRDQAASGGRRRFAPAVRPGQYLLTLNVDGEKDQKIINVIGDPTRPNQSRSAEFEDALFED